MQPAQVFVVLASLVAAVWLAVPQPAEDLPTGSIAASISSAADETLSCDQVLYLEELELLSGSGCS